MNFPHTILAKDLRGSLEATRGRIFGVTFVRRRDGTLRTMACRLGVGKHRTAGRLAFDPRAPAGGAAPAGSR